MGESLSLPNNHLLSRAPDDISAWIARYYYPSNAAREVSLVTFNTALTVNPGSNTSGKVTDTSAEAIVDDNKSTASAILVTVYPQ